MEAILLGCFTSAMQPKQTNIVFLKTHKTASSTMQSLLFRFAERHNLTMAFPKPSCSLQFCYPAFFSSNFVHPDTLPANMITSHMRFRKSALQKLMPKNTRYITILREPAAMFESLFTYYSPYAKSFKKVPDGSLKTLMQDPLRYYEPNDEYSYYARNTLTFDLGGENNRPATDVAYAHDFVEEVEKVFSLVMISEYFDESLVLLRKLLSWDLEDILYIKLNARTETSKKKISPDLVEKIRAWNSIDAYLYDYFNATLWVKLSDLGLDCVAKEVQLLRQAQERLIKRCFGSETPREQPGSQIKDKDLRPWQPSKEVGIVGYVLPEDMDQETRTHCLKFIMPEVSYTPKLLHSQLERQDQSRQNQTTTKPPTVKQPTL
ncbi:galactose-3-O-sulfotransferase 3-like [Cyprinodon tularosa]|uniref:galactose-3-O-sulfotransferase 3-like n=1 Tax=Cyprinodon tularosa TaxID=77115 RepID=UPI0018E1EF53|nr:galactose-3-O-sulfotransferase 3-like [Cyprinodon tularosa]